MTVSSFAGSGDVRAPATAGYRPGECNIGPAEIRRRRMVGHAGLVITLAVFLGLVLTDAPAVARLLLILPAAASASGHLQAWLRFCAGFGSRGIFNFGALGESTTVVDSGARTADRRRARQIGVLALAIGMVVGVLATFLRI
jgi:hypothetical protein